MRQIGICLLACMCSACVILGISYYQQKKIAVVDAVKLFNEYQMKKELEARAAGRLQYLNIKMDSIGNQSKMFAEGTAQKQELLNSYNQLSQQFQYEYEQSNRQINEMVWKRLNPLIDRYGKDKGLHLVIGANGMGSVLYNDDYFDHTNNLINFINKEYENNTR